MRRSATGQVAGVSLELRSGSPFGRYGDSVFQLSNPPYRLQGEVWVPLELLVEWLPRVQRKSAAVAPAAATPAVVCRKRRRVVRDMTNHLTLREGGRCGSQHREILAVFGPFVE